MVLRNNNNTIYYNILNRLFFHFFFIYFSRASLPVYPNFGKISCTCRFRSFYNQCITHFLKFRPNRRDNSNLTTSQLTADVVPKLYYYGSPMHYGSAAQSCITILLLRYLIDICILMLCCGPTTDFVIPLSLNTKNGQVFRFGGALCRCCGRR